MRRRQARRAKAVDSARCRRVGISSGESSGATKLRSLAVPDLSVGQSKHPKPSYHLAYVPEADVLHQSWIKTTSQPDLFQDLQYKGIEWRIAEAAGLVAAHWRSYCKRYDDVVRVLLGAAFTAGVSGRILYRYTSLVTYMVSKGFAPYVMFERSEVIFSVAIVDVSRIDANAVVFCGCTPQPQCSMCALVDGLSGGRMMSRTMSSYMYTADADNSTSGRLITTTSVLGLPRRTRRERRGRRYMFVRKVHLSRPRYMYPRTDHTNALLRDSSRPH